MQPRKPWAYTATPLQNLQNLEHEADSFDLGDNKDDWFVEPASFVVAADHDPRRDDGGPLGRRFCRTGWEVVGNHPVPTWHTPMRRDTATADGGVSGAVGPAGRTSDQARCAVTSTGVLWRQGIAWFAVPGIDEWSVVDTNIGAHGQQR